MDIMGAFPLIRRKSTCTLRVASQQLQDLLVLYSLRIQLGIVSTFSRDRVDVDIAQKLWHMKLAFSNFLARNQEIVTVYQVEETNRMIVSFTKTKEESIRLSERISATYAIESETTESSL
jgi:hypothetical protein